MLPSVFVYESFDPSKTSAHARVGSTALSLAALRQ